MGTNIIGNNDYGCAFEALFKDAPTRDPSSKDHKEMEHAKFLRTLSSRSPLPSSSSSFFRIETLNCEMKRKILEICLVPRSEKVSSVVISQHFALNFYKHFLLLYFYDSFEIFSSFSAWNFPRNSSRGRRRGERRKWKKEKSVKCEFIIQVLNLIYFDGSVLMAIFCRKKNIWTMIIFVLWHTSFAAHFSVSPKNFRSLL